LNWNKNLEKEQSLGLQAAVFVEKDEIVDKRGRK